MIGQTHAKSLSVHTMQDLIRPSVKDDAEAVLASALRTLNTEKNGLTALENALQNGLAAPFAEAVRVIGASKGRLIVTGIGKSGHVGSKLAATFASTGTAAFFVHSAEANHGDLGMISTDDVILALSWSGETAELKGVVQFATRYRIPLIAITAGADSSLSRAATTCLLMPKVTEACPHGLAPTTSTLMQLTIGDALAIALLEARGFTPGDFRTFHPGGSLGASLTHVSEVMHRGDRIPTVLLGTLMPEAMQVLSHKRFGCVAVLDNDGYLAGIVTEGDLARNLHRNLAELSVDDVMTRSPKTVAPQTLASSAMSLLEEYNISVLIVTEENRPVGVIHFHDLLRIKAA